MEGGGLQFRMKGNACLRRQSTGLAHQRIQRPAQRADALLATAVIPLRLASVQAQSVTLYCCLAHWQVN
jgi:hypothetical protein